MLELSSPAVTSDLKGFPPFAGALLQSFRRASTRLSPASNVRKEAAIQLHTRSLHLKYNAAKSNVDSANAPANHLRKVASVTATDADVAAVPPHGNVFIIALCVRVRVVGVAAERSAAVDKRTGCPLYRDPVSFCANKLLSLVLRDIMLARRRAKEDSAALAFRTPARPPCRGLPACTGALLARSLQPALPPIYAKCLTLPVCARAQRMQTIRNGPPMSNAMNSLEKGLNEEHYALLSPLGWRKTGKH